MKYLLCLLSAALLASCAPFFTKQDAAAIGSRMAADSLALAERLLNGEKLNLKAETAAIGLKAAGAAVKVAQANLAAVPAPVVLTAAETVALAQIDATGETNVARAAAKIAASAADTAGAAVLTP
jgi:hypothetical protein